MNWLDLVIEALRLAVLIIGEAISGQTRARLAKEKYELDQAKFREIAQRCLDKMRDDAAKESAQAAQVEDQVDREESKKP